LFFQRKFTFCQCAANDFNPACRTGFIVNLARLMVIFVSTHALSVWLKLGRKTVFNFKMYRLWKRTRLYVDILAVHYVWASKIIELIAQAIAPIFLLQVSPFSRQLKVRVQLQSSYLQSELQCWHHHVELQASKSWRFTVPAKKRGR